MILSELLATKAAAAAVGAVLVAGGGAAAAVALPAAVSAAKPAVTTPASDVSTSTGSEDGDEKAPSSEETPESEAPDALESGTPGPDATGPAAYGLCNAWVHGGLTFAKAQSGNPAAAALVTAGGGTEEGVGTYCAGVVAAKKGTPAPDASESEDTAPSAQGLAKKAEKQAEKAAKAAARAGR